MKLLNKSLKYLSIFILLIVSVWSVVFYFNMLDEIQDSIDDGLENYKILIIQKAKVDSVVLEKQHFDESNYALREISKSMALSMKDRYTDTLMYMQDEDDLEPVRMLTTTFANNGHYYKLKIINSMVEEDDLIEDLFWSVFWLYFILVFSIIVINNIVLKNLWKPFYSFLHQVTEFRLGTSKELPSITSDVKEFTNLRDAVNGLLQHSLETYEQQKQFIENASHELQTPLAIVINKLELLLEKGKITPSDADSLGQVLQIVERLVRLNKSLLLLTKIENKQFLDRQRILLNEIVRQNIADLEDFATFKGVEIFITEAAQLQIDMDVTLANIIISNLVKNAIFHNVPQGQLHITITKNAIQFVNTGRPEPLRADKIFNRFYKASDNALKGTGLGLAIVKAICGIYDFNISYRFETSKHYFGVQFSQP